MCVKDPRDSDSNYFINTVANTYRVCDSNHNVIKHRGKCAHKTEIGIRILEGIFCRICRLIEPKIPIKAIVKTWPTSKRKRQDQNLKD